MSFSASIADLVEGSTAALVQSAGRWPRVELGCLVRILNGFPFKSDQFTHGEGLPLIRIREVTNGRTDTRYRGPIPDGYWVEKGELPPLIGMWWVHLAALALGLYLVYRESRTA